jgi:fucose permease
MTSMHAFYSLGAIGGSLAAAAFAAGGITLLPSLAAVGGAGALVVAGSGRWLLPEDRGVAPASEASEVSAAGAGDAGDEAPRAVPAADRAAARRVRRLVIALGVLGVCALVGEGSAGDWSAVYLRDNLGTSAAVAALAFSAFSATMTLGRGIGDRFIHRFGVVPVIRACGLIATAGLGLALATAVPVVAVAGFTAFGLGLSAVVPQVFAAGGRADPVRPGSGLAKVVGFGYAGMAAGPAIIGLVAGRIGLHLALLIPLALTAWIFVAAPVLARAGPGGPRIRSG